MRWISILYCLYLITIILFYTSSFEVIFPCPYCLCFSLCIRLNTIHKRYVRYHWIPAGLQSQATAVEILDGILAYPLGIGTITWRRGVLLLFVVCVHRTRGAIPRMPRHRDWKITKQSFSLKKISLVLFYLRVQELIAKATTRWRSTKISDCYDVGHLDALVNRRVRRPIAFAAPSLRRTGLVDAKDSCWISLVFVQSFSNRLGDFIIAIIKYK